MFLKNGILKKIRERFEIEKIIKEAEVEIDYRIETMEKKYETTAVSEMEKPLINARKAAEEISVIIKNIRKINIISDKDGYEKLMAQKTLILSQLADVKKYEEEIIEIHNHIGKCVRECARMCKLIDQKLPRIGDLIEKYKQFSTIEKDYKKYISEQNEITEGKELDPFEALVKIYTMKDKIEKTFDGVSTLFYETYDTSVNFEKIDKLKIVLKGFKNDYNFADNDKKYIVGNNIKLLRVNTSEYVTLLEGEIEKNRK